MNTCCPGGSSTVLWTVLSTVHLYLSLSVALSASISESGHFKWYKPREFKTFDCHRFIKSPDVEQDVFSILESWCWREIPWLNFVAPADLCICAIYACVSSYNYWSPMYWILATMHWKYATIIMVKQSTCPFFSKSYSLIDEQLISRSGLSVCKTFRHKLQALLAKG